VPSSGYGGGLFRLFESSAHASRADGSVPIPVAGGMAKGQCGM